MAKTFEVMVYQGEDAAERETYTVNPLNVTLLRRVWTEKVLHAEGCGRQEDERCPFSRVMEDQVDETLQLHGCRAERDRELTEILFVNTVGPRSSIMVREPKRRVTELLNDSLR